MSARGKSKYLPVKIIKTPQGFHLDTMERPVRVRLRRQNAMDVCEEVPNARLHLGPKRYITRCYLQPKQLPVRYSETLIMKIGSTKKRYFESVYYETKVIPFKWSETMVANLDVDPYPHMSDAIISREEIYHYIPLVPQPVECENCD